VSSIVDTHSNNVGFEYSCAETPQCELTRITYTGTVVDFFWETRPDVLSYATGKSIGRAKKRLITVRVTHGGAVQKAFRIAYNQSPTSGLSRLITIQQYGTNVVLMQRAPSSTGRSCRLTPSPITRPKSYSARDRPLQPPAATLGT
jgi:hypothetical protein